MESCHSVLPPIVNKVPHPPPSYSRLPPKVYSTLGHLIEIIEQLSSRENLSSVLRDLVADGDDPSSTNGRSAYVDLDPGTIIKVAQILRKLNANCATMATETSGTKTASSASLDAVSGETPGLRGGERAQPNVIDVRNMTLSKQDSLYLVKKIKDFEQKCKPLQEKNKKFLERNMELAAQNRSLKEQIRNITDENKKLKEGLDQSRRKCSVLSRQLNQEKMEKASLEVQADDLAKARTQVAELESTITSLRQAAAEKDRRMEVLQHRKKRRLRVSAEHLSRLSSPCSNADDERSLDSDMSFTSMSNTTLSDEELQEEFPHDDAEKMEKNYKKLMKEQLSLHKSTAQLQGILGWCTDPQRYTKQRIDFETDLYVARCKIENLEECLQKYKEWDHSWVLEKDELVSENQKLTTDIRALEHKVEEMRTKLRETTQKYEDAKEQVEHLEFLVLETQECDDEKVETPTVSVYTSTKDLGTDEQHEKIQEQAKALNELRCSEAALRLQLEMGENMQQEYRATIQSLQEKLEVLLKGQGSEVNTVLAQLKQAEQHVTDMENTNKELQSKVVSLQGEKSELSDRLKQYRGRLDAQEHSLALSRDEREELLQVKRKAPDNLLNNRLKLAEVGQDSIRERSLERERSQERMISPLTSPRSPRQPSAAGGDSFSSYAKDRLGEGQFALSRRNSETQESFEKQVSTLENTEPVTFEASPRHIRTNSVPILGNSELTRHHGNSSEVDHLRRQISELQDENDVLRYELAQKGHGDSDASGSDSEDSRLVELRETIENLRERVQCAESSERQYRDRIKLAEKHITELEFSESVLRDHVEEGNADCDKLRKQIVRLQRKIRELKEVNGEKEQNEQSLVDKLKYFEEAESTLTQRISELEENNQILKQHLELKEENDADAETVATLKEKINEIEKANSDLGSKVLDLEEANEILRDNWKKVADEEADRRECLEEKIKVLECANKDLKSKLKEQESDLDLSACQSIASELNEDAIEQLNERIRELENELQTLKEGNEGKIETLQDNICKMKENEVKLTETLAEMENSDKILKNRITFLEKSEDSQEVASTLHNYEDKITQLRSSQEDLLERLDSMENHEDDLKEKIIHMEKAHEKQLEMLEREIAEYQQQEDDLCARVKELEDSEKRLLSKIENYKENEMNLKNKIEEIENRETSLTIGFSQRVEELEKTEKEIAEKFYQKIHLLENKESQLIQKVDKLEQENNELKEKITLMEKHESELSEKDKDNLEVAQAIENSELTKGPMNGNSGVVELQNKVESFAKLESESSKNISFDMDGGDDIESVKALNQSLKEEVNNLTLKIKESEKEQKILASKVRKEEKKRKKSQRTDNLDDYDTLAREAVTFKIEVEQLRTENTDLHERVMELDESERALLEENESLKCELEKLKCPENSMNGSESKETELEERIRSLEDTKQNLMDEIAKLKLSDNPDGALIVPVKQSSVDSAYESSRECMKEYSDKLVGTDDFMEGVMCGQEQGKPVSSMFVRIKALETENQELATKLSGLTATDSQVKQLSEKVKGLEENEDSLMERVMELEDVEDRLKRELNKAKQSLSEVSDLEDEISALQESEKDLKERMDVLDLENLTLKKTIECSGVEKGDIAIQLAKVQKAYEDEKKKVESLLKGEEKLMKSVSSQKKAIQEMEDELAATQEKLEELQTDYENKLSDKDENEKLIKEELNKVLREKETLKKKFQEYEKANSELEDEIEACKISESRMFHKHQQLITQNQELELKLDKLVKLLPYSEQHGQDEIDGAKDSDKSRLSAMSENPELVPENPLTTSIFTETELELLRSKTPDTELLGSVPLDMLRKMQEFDERENNYQSKIKEIEQRNMKLSRKVKVIQGKEKDLKQEIRELQLELLKYRESTSSLRASTSSLDFENAGSDEGMDSDNQSSEGLDDIFKGNEGSLSQYENMSQKQLVLTAKLFEEKQNQDIRRITELEECMDQSKELLKQLVGIVTSEPHQSFIQNVEAFKETQKKQSGTTSCILEVLESVTGLRRRLEAMQDSEEKLRISLAEDAIIKKGLSQEYSLKIQQLETQIQELAAENKQLPEPASKTFLDIGTQSDSYEPTSSTPTIHEGKTRYTSPVREFHLETSKTINIDVTPTQKTSSLAYLSQSETIRVDVQPQYGESDYVGDQSETSSEYSFTGSPRMMDKAEDVLRQRIRELEKLEKHLKKQVSDLETDREELHEIARKDKNIIHEQNVLIRELQLSQRNLQAQIQAFETSENTLYARLDELESDLENKSDQIRHLEILEGRLKDLVKQYKLDERILQTKSETLESSIKEMSAKEQTLKQKVENLESEKTAFSERSEYLQMRLKELENAEIDLAQRSKNQENIMQSLQNTVIELETFGANAQSRVVELEQINFELQQRLHHAMTENSPLSRQLATVQNRCDAMESELSAVKDSEIKLKQENDSLLRNESELQQQVKVLRMKKVELEGKVRDLEESDALMKDKLSKLQRSENTLKYRVQEMENSGIQTSADLSSSLKDGTRLPRTLEDCQRRIIMLQATNAELQSRLAEPGTGGSTGNGQAPRNQVIGQWTTQGQSVLRSQSECAAGSSRLSPAGEEIILDLATGTPGQRGRVSPTHRPVQEKMAKTTATGVNQSAPTGQHLSHDQLVAELLQSLEAPGGHEEDKHWREIESRMEMNGRGSEKWINIGKATSMYAGVPNGSNTHRSHNKEEELELGVTLQSETESQGNYSQNDMYSGRYSAPVYGVQQRLFPEQYAHVQRNSGELRTQPLPQSGPPREGQLRVNDSFGESLYVPSSTHDSLDEYSDQVKEMITPARNQPAMSSVTRTSAHSVTESVSDSGRGTASVSMATSNLTLRERIAHIERQLSARESDSAREFNSEIDLTAWKAKINESGRKLEMAEKENKAFKDEINKLEKNLEEKTRLYLLLESFLKNVETVLKNKNMPEGEVVSRIQGELERVQSSMEKGGNLPGDISLDPAALNTEVARKDRELAAKRNELDSMMRELRQWQQECRSIEDMRSNALDSLRGLEVEVTELQLADKQLKELKDEHNMLQGQGEEDEQGTPRSAATATLRARVVQLTSLCNEKDALIKKLVHELKRLKSAKNSQQQDDRPADHNHNHLSRSSSQSSIDSLERMSYVSDTELIRDSNSNPQHMTRPRSADAYHHRQIAFRHSHHGNQNLHNNTTLPPRIYASRMNSTPHSHGLGQHNRTASMPQLPNRKSDLYNGYSPLQGGQTLSYVAVADYDPSMFSMSGHPRLELALKEGDLVKVTGSMNRNGYYEGEVNGQVGLVPASYLQPALPHRVRGNRRFVSQHLIASPERVVQMYSHLQSAHQPDTHAPSRHQHSQSVPNVRSNSTGPEYSTSPRYRQTLATGPPHPPSNFHVEKIVGNNSLMLAWQPVSLDGNGCNNGLKVTGYRIFKNNKILVHPRGPLASKAIIENVDIHTQHRLGVQTVTADGQVSELSEIMYEGVEEVTSDENSDTESEMDMGSMLDMDVYSEGPKRMFMGIYDYDPTKNSPQDHPNCELAFNAGDTITVYGRQRSDGFYHGEINNVRGLVPAFFIEEIPQAPPRTKKISSRSKQQQSKETEEKQSR